MKIIFVVLLLIKILIHVHGIIVNLNEFNKKLITFKNDNLNELIFLTNDKININSNSTINQDEKNACNVEQSRYSECLETTRNDRSNCVVILGEKCKDFYHDLIGVAPSCNKTLTPNQKDFFTHLYKYLGKIFEFECINDGKCPMNEDMALFALGDYKSIHRWTNPDLRKQGYTPSNDVIEENCNLPECSEKAIEVLRELILFNNASVNIYKDIIPYKKNTTKEYLEYSENLIRLADEQREILQNSIRKLELCNFMNGFLTTTSKSIFNGIANSLFITIIFYLFI